MNSPIIFMGTPDFAVPALEALHHTFGVTAVVTVPDKRQGRGRSVQPSAVKLASERLGITRLFQPLSLKDESFIEQLTEINPAIICVIAFRILPVEVYSLATIAAFNVHGSILPRYRGAAPINHAIINGDKETGVTSFLLNSVVDTGKTLITKTTEIADGTTAGELYLQLQPLAARCAVETTAALLNGTITATEQDDALASPAPKVFKSTSEIIWQLPASRVRQWILGHSPTPGAWTTWNNGTLKILNATVASGNLRAGEFVVHNNSLLIGCSDICIEATHIQLPGKKVMKTADYIRGYRGPTNGFMG